MQFNPTKQNKEPVAYLIQGPTIEYMLFKAGKGWHSLTQDGYGESVYVSAIEQIAEDEEIVQKFYPGDSVTITF